MDSRTSNSSCHVNDFYFLICRSGNFNWCFIVCWLTKRILRKIITKINRRCYYVLSRCIYCCIFVTLQKKNQTHGTLFKLVNLMGKGISQIHNLGANLYLQHCRTYDSHILPTSCFYQSKRSKTLWKWHLSQTWPIFLMVTPQHHRIYLGTTIFKRFMYFFI